MHLTTIQTNTRLYHFADKTKKPGEKSSGFNYILPVCLFVFPRKHDKVALRFHQVNRMQQQLLNF